MIVVDCDSHVMEPATLWEEYIDPQFREQAIRIETIDGSERLVIADSIVLPGGLAGLGGANLNRQEIFSGKHTYADGCPKASYDGDARCKLLDEWGVDKCVVFPTIGILPIPTDNLDLISAYFRAYNNWQADFQQSAIDRIAPIAVVNWRDISSACTELDRCLKLGFKGLFVPPEVVDGNRPGGKHFDPLWARLEEANLPGCLHVIVRFSGSAVPFASWHTPQPGLGPTFGFGLGAPGQMMPALSAMILEGLFDRFPRLKVAVVESGCGWAGYLIDRLNEKHALLGNLGPTKLKLMPGEYVQRNCYFVAEPDERSIGSMLNLVGDDKIVWGSDFPHIDSDLRAPQSIRAAISELTETQQSAVLGANACQLFQL